MDSCCLDHVINNITISGLPCKCPPACLINNYEKRLSVAKWPNYWFKCRSATTLASPGMYSICK